MYEARLFTLLIAPCFKHTVHMPDKAGTALHCQTRRLIENKDLGVFINQHLLEDITIFLTANGARSYRTGGLLINAQWRNTDRLACLQTCICFYAPAIHTNLSGTQQFLQVSEPKSGKMDLEPAIKTHTRLVCSHILLFNACHGKPDQYFLGARASRACLWCVLQAVTVSGSPECALNLSIDAPRPDC